MSSREGPTSGGVVLLAQDGTSARVVYNYLRGRFDVVRVVLEEPVPRLRLLAHRVERLGLKTVAGQVLFQLGAVPVLTLASRRRITEIKQVHGLDESTIDPAGVTRIRSVNTDEARELLRALVPRVVVINGTRIVSPETLRSVSAPFLNIHAGITPMYRGVHGGYWALAQGQAGACGVTVHVVDEGVDTGPILGQEIISPTSADTFVTYPLLQLAAGLPLLAAAIERVGFDDARSAPPNSPSRLWYHPTLGEYLSTRRRRGVR
jgi:folate-dependent phosphoribosylglycinamide formyltransferase PurN